MDPRALPRTGALRALVATGATGTSAVGLGRLAARTVAGAPAPDALVATVVLALGALAAAVLTAGCAMLALSSCATACGRRWRRTETLASRLVPVVLRRALTVGLGTGLALGFGTTALADEVDVGWEVTTGSSTQAQSESPVPPAAAPASTEESAPASGHAGAAHPGVPVVSSVVVPTVAPAGADTPSGVPPTTPPDPTPRATVTVQRGDSLWSITADLLPAGATEARIGATWPLLYAANRDVVGTDPGLIHPGDVLTVPAEVTA